MLGPLQRSTEKPAETSTKVADLSPKPERLWAWWGEPWPSGICYVGEGSGARVLEEAHVPTPVGEKCNWCHEEIQAGDQGVRQPLIGSDGIESINIHKECQLRSVLGSMKHIKHECSCYGGESTVDEDYSRADALAVWEWAKTNTYGSFAETQDR